MLGAKTIDFDSIAQSAHREQMTTWIDRLVASKWSRPVKDHYEGATFNGG
ncbi:MAG: hypothetical protein ACC628_00470 [Pirellulaceae bacterium]